MPGLNSIATAILVCFLVFLGFLSKENTIADRDLLHFNKELDFYLTE